MKQRTIGHAAALRFICDNLDIGADSARCRAIRRHVENCSDCYKQLEALKHTIALYQSYPEPHIPASTKKRLREMLKGI